MFELIKLFFDICLLKKGPQDVPHSVFVFWLALVFYAIAGLLLLYLSTGLMNSIIQLLVEIALILGFTGGMLIATGKFSRFFQTVSAMLGADGVISFLGLPVFSSLMIGEMSMLPFFALIGLMIWHLFVMGHIFRHALNKSYGFGLGLAFLYLFSTYQLMMIFFPVAAGTG